MDKYIPLILISFFAAFLTTPFAGRVAHKTGFVDEPKPHKVHLRPIPLLGGVAIYLALAAALGVALLQTKIDSFLWELAAIGLGSTMLVLVGLWDDRHGMSPRVKLLAQCGAAVLLVVSGIQVDLFPWPILNIVVTIVWVVGITNAINLMDNMDGLAAGVSAVAAIFFTLLASSAHQGLIAGMASAVAGASLGFLFYNLAPAMVFMGDAGSLLLGFLLAVIGIRYSPATLPIGSTWMVPIVVLGLPIFDTALVTYSRLRSRRPISQGGTDHTSHRLARLGFGTTRSVVLMYMIAVALGNLAVLMTQSNPETAMLFFVVLLTAGAVGIVWLGGKRALPPANPPILIFAEEEQARQAIRAARRISSNLHILLSPACTSEMAETYLEDMAQSADAFHAWRAGIASKTAGRMEHWVDVFRLEGTIRPLSELTPAKLEELLRDGRAVILCRGIGWADGLATMLAGVRKKTVIAPGIQPASIRAEIWDDTTLLGNLLENKVMGITTKGERA
jgi:UDP-GlcNAc:undecaprenyl-phosphate/decaprenyl-phosphate GlcNAc-1-phosphate transferase